MKSDTDKPAVNKINSTATRSHEGGVSQKWELTRDTVVFSTLKAQCVTFDEIYWDKIE